MSTWSGRAPRIAAGIILAWLVANLLGLVHLAGPQAQKASADLDHLVVFPLGWIAGRRWLSRQAWPS